jgi:hypothetical protein
MSAPQLNGWRKEARRCEHCHAEYRPQREAQSYCSSECKRAAAYGRERFRSETKGPRRRRLEGSEMSPGIPIAGSVRNGTFSSTETIACKGHVSLDNWPRCKCCGRWELTPRYSLPRHMFCTAARRAAKANKPELVRP